MKLNSNQLEAAGYLFEKVNGNNHSALLEKIITESGLSDLKISNLEKIILDGINSGLYKDNQSRTSAYWALSKRFNNELIPNFKKWLQFEIENGNSGPLFQLMIALDNIEEPVFHEARSGHTIDEIELNLRDAKSYLLLNKKSF